VVVEQPRQMPRPQYRGARTAPAAQGAFLSALVADGEPRALKMQIERSAAGLRQCNERPPSEDAYRRPLARTSSAAFLTISVSDAML
jgi:hypothetical protein